MSLVGAESPHSREEGLSRASVSSLELTLGVFLVEVEFNYEMGAE